MLTKEQRITLLVDKLLGLADNPNQEPVRIQFMVGKYPNEVSSGGMAREPLIRFLTTNFRED